MTKVDIDQLIQSSQKGYRVDVVGLAKKLNLQVFSVDLPDDQSGHICKDSGQPYIEVNRSHPITRQRFTIAHEISHYLKHESALEKQGQLDRKSQFSSPEEAKMEAEADEAAASILMPKKLVEAYFTENNWSTLTRFTTEMIEQIANEFRVSRAMAITRLRELGIAIPFLSFA